MDSKDLIDDTEYYVRLVDGSTPVLRTKIRGRSISFKSSKGGIVPKKFISKVLCKRPSYQEYMNLLNEVSN